MGLLVAPALLLLLRLPSLFEPRWYGDEGVFAAVATDLLHGQSLYAETWDNKPPLIFLTYAAVQKPFGNGILPLHAAATIAALVTLLAVMALASRWYGRPRAVVAGIIFAVIVGTPVIEANLALTETFMIAPISLAMLVALFAHDRPERTQTALYLAAGVLFGIAANYKQVALFDTAALVLVLSMAPVRRGSAIGAVVAGFCIPHLVALAAFAATGALNQYLYAVAGSLGAYTGESGRLGFADWVVRCLPVGVSLGYAFATRKHAGAFTALPLIWLGFAVVGAFSSPFDYPHYLVQAAAPFAIVVGGLRLPTPSHPAALAWAVVVAITLVLGIDRYAVVIRDRTQTDPLWYYAGFVSRQRGELEGDEFDARFDGTTIAIRDILAAVERDGGGETFYVWGELPWLYAAGSFSNPTRYPTAYLGTWVPGARDEIMRDLIADEPVYLVISRSAPQFPALEELARVTYQVLAAQGDWQLYRRLD